MQDIALSDSRLTLEYGKRWDFLDQPIVYDFPLDKVTSGSAANSDISATLVGITSAASKLLGGHFVTSVNSAGIDANNTSAITITAAGTTMITKTNVANIVVDTPVSLGTPTLVDVAAGSAIKMAIVNGTAANTNSGIVHTTLKMADAANYPAPGLTVVSTSSGTVTISDGVKGICALVTPATDDDELYLAAELEDVKFLDGKVFEVETFIQFTEVATNVFFGVMNAVATGAMTAAGAGPKATGDYVGIWKVDGGTKWYCGAQSNGTATPTTDTLSDVTAGGSSYQRLRIKVTCENSTRAIAEFTVDGANIGTVHFAYASATEMQLMIGVRAGSAAAETLNVDYLEYKVLR